MLKKKLLDFSNNVFSQSGENGIIEQIFKVIGIKHKRCCEFGAADGFTLSNTACLWTNGFEGILIESNKLLYEQLRKKTKDYSCKVFNYMVGNNHDNDSLDYIFTKEQLNRDLDILSIDVDGNDYYILDSLKNINSRIIVCEYNPNIPYFMDLYGDYNNDFGSSVIALNRICEPKGYFLACITDSNCIFVQKIYKPMFEDYELDIAKISCNKYLNYIITNYKGEYVVSGNFCYGMNGILSENINNMSNETINRNLHLVMSASGTLNEHK